MGLLIGCGSDDGSGSMGNIPSVAPPAMGNLPMTTPGAAGSAAPPATMVPPTNTMTPMGAAGSAAMPMGMAGSTAMPEAGSNAPMPMGDPSMCPPAPDGASAGAIAALEYTNKLRLAAGAGCVNMVATINTAAEKHCQYYAMNVNTNCTADPHGEMMGCPGYVGDLGTRLKSAGYTNARGYGEVMAFQNNPMAAIDQWVNSVWHRTPMLSPWTGDMGYGAAERCDTIDFGNPSMAPADAVLVYPYDGQVDVPTSFNGMYEGPMPPAPSTGWPSASPITLYAKKFVVTEHVLTKDGDTTPLEHVWLDSMDPMWSRYLTSAVFMYANAPFEANTKYRVKITGTYQGGMLSREWTFTTGAAPRWPGGG